MKYLLKSLFLAVMLFVGTGVANAEQLTSSDGAYASVTWTESEATKTNYYSTLPEAWEFAVAKSSDLSVQVTIEILNWCVMDDNSLKMDEGDIVLTSSSLQQVRSSNSSAEIYISGGKLSIEGKVYLWNNNATSGNCINVSGTGQLIIDSYYVCSKAGYAIYTTSSVPVIINSGNMQTDNETNDHNIFALCAGSTISTFTLNEGTLYGGAWNPNGSLNDWLGDGKALYLSHLLHNATEMSIHDNLEIKDCTHEYDEWTYDANTKVASSKCVICKHVNEMSNPVARVDYVENNKNCTKYVQLLDKDFANATYRRTATVTMLDDAEIETNDKNEFYVNGDITFIGGDHTITGTIYNDTYTLTIESGMYKSKSDDHDYVIDNTNKLIINGGTFVGSQYAIENNVNGECVINDGDFGSTSSDAVYVNKGNVTINGGTFHTDAIDKKCLNVSLNATSVVLNGGKFVVSYNGSSACGGIENNIMFKSIKDLLGSGKAYYIDEDCERYLITGLSESVQNTVTVYVGNCADHIYVSSADLPSGGDDVACSYCGETLAQSELLAKVNLDFSLKSTATSVATADFYATNLDPVFDYIDPNTTIKTTSDIQLLGDATCSKVHDLTNGAEMTITGGDNTLTYSSAKAELADYFFKVDDDSKLTIASGTYKSQGNSPLIRVTGTGTLNVTDGIFQTKDGNYSIYGAENATIKLKAGEYQHGLFSEVATLNNWLDDTEFYYITKASGTEVTKGDDLTSIGNYVKIGSCQQHSWSEWKTVKQETVDSKTIITQERTCSKCGTKETQTIEVDADCDHITGVDWSLDTEHTGICPVCGEDVDLTIDGAASKIEITPAEAHYYSSVTFNRSYKPASESENWYSLCVPFTSTYSDWKDYYDIYKIYNIVNYYVGGDGYLKNPKIIVNQITDDEEEVSANTPYFVRPKVTEYGKANDISVTFDKVPVTTTTEEIAPLWCASTDEYFYFYCNYTTFNNDDKDFIFYNVAGGTVNVVKTASITPTRWYMRMIDRKTATPEVKSFRICIFGEEDDDETGISSATMENGSGEAVYNLQGQRLNAPVKGQINIVNGKKVFVK